MNERKVYSGLWHGNLNTGNSVPTLRAERAPDTGHIEIIDNQTGEVQLHMTLLAAENLAYELSRAAKLGRDLAK